MTQAAGKAFVSEKELDSGARPFWSVIVPIYQRTRFLEECLTSILNQDPGPEEMEIIVVDDASPSDLSGMVHGLGRGRVRYRRNHTNIGLYPNTNRAICGAQGKWIHILHDDDWVGPEFYREMRKSAEHAPPSVGVVFCMYHSWTEQDRSVWSPPAFRDSDGVMPREFLSRMSLGNPLNLPAVIYKRAAFADVGLFREDLPFTADWEWYVRSMVKLGWYHNTKTMAFYRVHDHNLTQTLTRTGRAAENIRRSLDIFAGVLPPDIAAACLPQARQNHARDFLISALECLHAQDGPTARTFLVEALKTFPDSCAFSEFAKLLQHPASGPLRRGIAALIIDQAGARSN